MSGKPLISEVFQSAESVQSETLTSGLLTAIQGATAQIAQNSDIESISIANLTYHFQSFGKYQIVLVTDKVETPRIILRKLGYRFMKEHGEKVLAGELNKISFAPFTKAIHEIVQEVSKVDQTKMINPSKRFTPQTLYRLPENLRSIAVAMITLKEGSIKEIAAESGKNEEETANFLSNLQEMGFIGKKISNGESIYFYSIGSV